MAKKYSVKKSFTYDGKRYYVYADNEVDAEVKKRLRIKELEDNTVISSGDMLFRVWKTRCIEMYKSAGEDSMKRDDSIIRNHILPVLGDMPLKKIRSIDCQCVLKNMGDKELAKSTIHQAFLLMNFIFEKAQFNDLIIKNPCTGVVEPNGKKEKRRALTTEEEEIFLRVADRHRFRVFAMMYYCGCRPEEARKALGSDILNMGTYYALHVRGTKSENADRYVPIPAELWKLIKDTPKDAPIATNNAGKRHDDNSWKRAWKGLRRAMNIEMGCKVYRNALVPPYPLAEDLVPYCFRHTYCTNLQKQGVDIRAAQYLMGHSDIKLTANIYTHSGVHNAEEAAKILCKENEGVVPSVVTTAENG